ncbi:MAG: hypothetical protein HQ507_00685 [Candidatus Marinimicrobia bacterium]|nr:hypothetical protein [Candidatus Neomarinimicrobiota bacterium]
MSEPLPVFKVTTPEVNQWLLWTSFLSAGLIFVSLWLVSSPYWHLIVTVSTLLSLWLSAPKPLKTFATILGLVVFLAILQILFSEFMRALFLKALHEGFFWSDWQYLMLAVERFAWPLVMVNAFQSQLNNPRVIAQLTVLFTPLKWLGLKIDRFQILVTLAIKFIPSLRREWHRFTHFQTYFVSGLPPKTLRQKLSFWQGVFKAMVSHTIQRAVSIGDILAISGLPLIHKQTSTGNRTAAALLWLCMGLLFLLLEQRIFILWIGMTVWLALVSRASQQENIE